MLNVKLNRLMRLIAYIVHELILLLLLLFVKEGFPVWPQQIIQVIKSVTTVGSHSLYYVQNWKAECRDKYSPIFYRLVFEANILYAHTQMK